MDTIKVKMNVIANQGIQISVLKHEKIQGILYIDKRNLTWSKYTVGKARGKAKGMGKSWDAFIKFMESVKNE